MTAQLYCFGESGNSYKAALTLELAGADWAPVFVDFFAGESRTPAYRETVNEMGEAPVLVDGDLRLSQSGAIQHHVAETLAPGAHPGGSCRFTFANTCCFFSAFSICSIAP